MGTEDKIRNLEIELNKEKEKNKKLERLLQVYQKYIPQNQLQYIKGTEQETNINFLQKAIRRKQQTTKFLSLSKIQKKILKLTDKKFKLLKHQNLQMV